MAAILSVCMLYISVLGGTESFFALSETGGQAVNVSEQRDTDEASEYGDSLILPDSYDQYLPLGKPSDVSVTENYTAIADGNFIYIYDRAADEYRKYEHAVNLDDATNAIAKLQFADNGILYFLDVSLRLYSLEPKTLEMTRTSLFCNTFAVYADTVYFTNTSQILTTTLDRLDSSEGVPVISDISKPAIAQDNGVLYYTESGKILCKADDPSFLRRLTDAETVVSLAVSGGILYYTDTAGNLYVYDLTTSQKLNVFEGGYSALCVYDGYVYAVRNSVIRQYSTESGDFTAYEICASSSGDKRLSDATQTLLSGNLLITTDNGNDRISVYDVETKEYRAIPCALAPSYLASDGKTVMVSNASAAVLYDLESGTALQTFSDFSGNLVGVGGAYGNYYFVTDSNYFYRAAKNKDGEYELENSPKPSVSHTARLLSQDIYGELYVAYSDGTVYRFNEEGFLSPSDPGERVCTVPVETERIAVDYEQTVYALYRNEVYVCTNAQAKYPLGKRLVYFQTEETRVKSFTFGVEDGGVYLLYEGDFIIKTYDIPIPTVREIAVNGTDEKIFGNETAEFSVVKTTENAIMVTFDIEKLNGAEFFPYLSYLRDTESRTALKLGETEKYDLIAVYNETTKTYSTALVLKRYCEELPKEDYLKAPVGFTDNTGYLTNALALYKYPYLTELLTVCDLPKNAAVTVLGEIDRLNCRYYYISFADGEGVERKGYVPESYVTSFNGTPPESEIIEYGGRDTDWDSIWRMVFLLLGCASVCVLVDYLILHKKKN